MFERASAWVNRNLPKREDLEHSRWVGPLARRHELWRFTRRSVPRGVAAGLLVGIFALIPGVQMIGAALLCVPSRGNIPIAALMTFLSNPATTPLILLAAAWVGNWFGFKADLSTLQALFNSGASLGDWTRWFVSDAAPAVLFGLAVIAVVTASIGYLLAKLFWAWWIGRKRRLMIETMRNR
ncbi:DUF2062 domain-containing protein [Altererythrobacter aerius]|uniref:DUF2062 domain-containing protein n=1 Tax=Tsuneonella aeria TaxID=1837929 RepID=A0A6I4TBS7_9SPHN|nr:DUF2062 domain-containing protein [Tsuneonella aeria]MXO73858.1 DUF2062 domain-containing protein [Tsuneonella aeria]